MALEWKQTSCYNCGVCCGLEVQIENNQIVNVRADKASMRSARGYSCRKGRALKYFQHNKNRLDYPLKRVGDEFIQISWEQALSEIGCKVKDLQEKYGPKAFGVYGTGTGVDQVAMYPLQDLRKLLGSQWSFNPLSIEFASPWWAAGKMLGEQFPPVEGEPFASEVFICWGANSLAAHNVGSARVALREASENPRRMFIVVDPCLTDTARLADMHIMPKVGTDALLLRAIIAIIIKNGWEDKEYIEKYTVGWDKSKTWFEDFDADQALKVCQVPKDQIMKFIRILCTRKWGVHPDLGLFFGRHAEISCYLIHLLMIVTGCFLIKKTNTISNTYMEWGPYSDEKTPGAWRTWKTGGFPISSFYTGSALVECMEDPDEKNRMRALFMVAGNPARSWPDSDRLEKDFKDLDLFVVVDIAMTESARCADYVLPGTTGYERFGAMIFPGGYPVSTCTFKQQLLQPEKERRDDSKIVLDIIEASGLLPEIPKELYDIAEEGVKADDRVAVIKPVDEYLRKIGRQECRYPVLYKIMGPAMGSYSKAVFWTNFIYGLLKEEHAVNAGFKFPGIHPELENDPKLRPLVIRDQVFAKIDRSPSGCVMARSAGTLEGAIEDHVQHPDKKIHIFDEIVDSYMGDITPEKEAEATSLSEEFPFIISAGTHGDDSGVNTTMRNPATYVYRQPYVFLMNPDDAKSMGFADGQWVRVTTKTGSIKIPIKFSYDSAAGYGKISHHFGLYDEEGKAYGETVNKLTDAEYITEIAGDVIYRYVPCRVEALAEGEEFGLWNYEKISIVKNA